MKVVYSCITGGYDSLEWILGSLLQPKRGYRFVLFVDDRSFREAQRMASRMCLPWEIRRFHWDSGPSPVRVARYHKVNPQEVLFGLVDKSCWIDGSEQLRPDADLDELFSHGPLAAFRHPQRDCIYEEARACERLKKDLPAVMRAQVRQYEISGYPRHNGLAETACVVREHTSEVRDFCRLWWACIQGGSHRDQLSFDYAAWRQGLAVQDIPGCRDRSPYLRFRPHSRR